MEFVEITEDYITLGQLLKHINVISSGGMAKWYLSEYSVYVDGIHEMRRGRKLYSHTIVTLENNQTFKIIKK